MRRNRWHRLGWLALVFCVFGAAPALADGYKDGLDALEAGRWMEAEQHFRIAIEEKPEAKKRLFAKPYMPYYYLGVALAEQNECEAALQAFAESEHQGVVTDQADEYADLQRRRTVCREQIKRRAELARAVGAAEEAVEEARAAAQAVASLARTPDLSRRWEEGSPSLAAREAQARQHLDEATRALAAGRRGDGDLQALGRVPGLARQAREGFESIQAEARRLRGEVQASRQELLAQVDAAASEARSALRASEDLAPYPPSVTAQRREIVRLLDERESLAATAPLEGLESLRDRLRRAASRLRDEAAGPPGELVAAAEALFAGRYDQVLEILEERTFPSRRANAHAHLLRAAARYYLYETGGRTDETLLEAARRDAAVGRQMDSRLTLPERAFPPGFRELWETAGETDEPSS